VITRDRSSFSMVVIACSRDCKRRGDRIHS
jgi:hypothetical protein